MMDNSKGRCQHEKIVEPCGPTDRPGGGSSAHRLDQWMSLRLTERKKELTQERLARIREALSARSIVLVGMPGSGKSAVGRRLAARLDLPFVDADEEIERAAGQPITDIFKDHGEPYFRDGERKVIARLLRSGPLVLATGGGAFMVAETQENIRQGGISIWLKAELSLLLRRVLKRNNRPLLEGPRRRHAPADGDALSGLCQRRHHRGEPRPAARCHRRRESTRWPCARLAGETSAEPFSPWGEDVRP